MSFIFNQLTKIEQNDILSLYREDGEGWLSKSAVNLLIAKYNITINDLLLGLLPIAQDKAVMPVCHYHVGAIGLGESGHLYFGACQDFGHGPLNQTVHAEQAVISHAFSRQETAILKIACTDMPCGHCRQFLYELNTAQELEILIPQKPMLKLTTLLPEAFGPKELGQDATLLKSISHSIEAGDDHPSDIEYKVALEAAKASYAPYTKAYAGAAITTQSGHTYIGKTIENVGHNPSLPPIQAALVHLVMSGETYSDITSATLVHCIDNLIDQSSSSQITLTAVAPGITLRVYTI